MKPLQPTVTLQFDDKTFNVSELSEEVQRLVEFHDDWRNREADLVSDLTMCQSGLQHLQAQLAQAVAKHVAETTPEQPKVEEAPVVKPTRSTRGRK